jgi:predicted N-acetyltransferase YhbS
MGDKPVWRALARDEVALVRAIDRREVIDAIYYLVDGALVLRPEHYDMQGWPPGEIEKSIAWLLEMFDRGGWFCGVFDGEQMVAVAVLDGKFIGAPPDMLQLAFLHVSRDYRGRGLGRDLFHAAAAEARARGARRMYVSATPSQHTITFYLAQGCALSPAPDPALLALEPEDIHLEYALPAAPTQGGQPAETAPRCP